MLLAHDGLRFLAELTRPLRCEGRRGELHRIHLAEQPLQAIERRWMAEQVPDNARVAAIAAEEVRQALRAER